MSIATSVNQTLIKYISDNTIKIIKPIAEQVSYKLLKTIGILDMFKDSSSYNIYYHDDLEVLSKLRDDHYKSKVSHNRCDVLIEPIYDPKELNNTFSGLVHDFTLGYNRSYLNNSFPIFKDTKYDISLIEFSIPCGISLTFNIKVKSIEHADVILSTLYTKFHSGKMFQYHDLGYEYQLPFPILYTLYKLFTMRRTDPSFKFIQYLKLGSNKVIDIVIDKDLLLKKHQIDQFEIAIHKNQVFSLGKLTFDLKKPDTDKKNKIPDRYSIEFKYDLTFNRPISLQLSYPLVINNQLIPEELIIQPTSTTKTTTDNYVFKESIPINDSYYLLNNRSQFFNKYKTITVPKEENIIPIKQILTNEHIPIFQGIINIDHDTNDTPYIQVDLKNEVLPLLQEHHDIKALEDIIKTQQERSKSTLSSFININIFKGSDSLVVEKSKYKISNDLKITVTDHIENNVIYRILITMNTNLRYVDKDVIYKVLNYPSYTDKIILKNLVPLLENQYIKVKKIPREERFNFMFDVKEDLHYIQGNVYSGTKFKGERNGPYPAFRIGNLIIYPR